MNASLAIIAFIASALAFVSLPLAFVSRVDRERAKTSVDQQLSRAAVLLYRVQVQDEALASLPEDLRTDLDAFLRVYDQSLRSQ